jgi:hypothetical protein
VSERPVTPAHHSTRRGLPRLSPGVMLMATAALLALSALVFADLRWMFGFAVVVGVFGALALRGEANP